MIYWSQLKKKKYPYDWFCGPGRPGARHKFTDGHFIFSGGTNEINLIAMHNIINYELNGQKNEDELTYHSTDAIQQRSRKGLA